MTGCNAFNKEEQDPEDELSDENTSIDEKEQLREKLAHEAKEN